MMPSVRALAAFLSVAFLASCASGRNVIVDKRYSEVQRSVVKIDVEISGVVTAKDMVTGEVTKTEKKGGWVGSGVVTDVDELRNESIVMTAAHVSDVEPFMVGGSGHSIEVFAVSDVKITVTRFDGEECPAVRLTSNEADDVGALRVMCLAGTPMQIVDEVVVPGQEIMIAGAPVGYAQKDMMVVIEGKVIGHDRRGWIVSNIPVAPGLSGSPVISSGRVVGIFTRCLEKFHHVSISSPSWMVQRVHAEALRLWR